MENKVAFRVVAEKRIEFPLIGFDVYMPGCVRVGIKGMPKGRLLPVKMILELCLPIRDLQEPMGPGSIA